MWCTRAMQYYSATKRNVQGLGYGSGVEHLLGMHEALDSIPYKNKQKRKRNVQIHV
jgi:hypothetical protein